MNYSPELQEILRIIKNEVLKAQRPIEEIILDDVDSQNFLMFKKENCGIAGGKSYYIFKT